MLLPRSRSIGKTFNPPWKWLNTLRRGNKKKQMPRKQMKKMQKVERKSMMYEVARGRWRCRPANNRPVGTIWARLATRLTKRACVCVCVCNAEHGKDVDDPSVRSRLIEKKSTRRNVSDITQMRISFSSHSAGVGSRMSWREKDIGRRGNAETDLDFREKKRGEDR